jgi:hypothetical protein
MRIHAYTGNLLADAYTSPSLLEGFETASSSVYDETNVKESPLIPAYDSVPANGGSASYIQLPPGKSSSIEFTLARVRYSAIRNDPDFLTALATDLGEYAELPADLFMNLQFSAAADGSTLVLLSLPVTASAASAASTASVAALEGFLTIPPNFEAILYELQADLNTDNIRFNAVNTYLIANPSAIWSPTASDAPASKDTSNKLNFGVVSGTGGGGGGGGGGAADYAATRANMEESAGNQAALETGPPIINETIIIERPQKPDQPTFTGNFFVDLTNEILSDTASILNVFAGLFNFINPPKPKAASAPVSASLPMQVQAQVQSKKRHIAPSTAPSEPVIYDTSQPMVKFANKPKEVLDAEGKVYFKTEGDTSNDPTLTDKERRAAWRKVYPKGGR